MPRKLGIHHITAIASDPVDNLEFYAGFLGQRLVKKTVNFDDPKTYHLYYGDYVGTPGTIMTFFPWPGAWRGRTGAGQVTTVSYAVPLGSLEFWTSRAEAAGIYAEPVESRFGNEGIALRDPDGIAIELIESGEPSPTVPHKADIPADQAISRIHSATLQLQSLEPTTRLLDAMGYERIGEEGNRVRYRVGEDWLDLLSTSDGRRGGLGAGIVHHIAFRASDDEDEAALVEKVRDAGMRVTETKDRFYFRSVYFREPGGVLFEIATDPPGFTADEPLETLGETLMLPVWPESEHGKMAAALPKLTR